jgi:hypothetical protein
MVYVLYKVELCDFSEVRQPGVYFIQYGNTRSNDFIIDDHVYDKITDATSDVWVPIHMNHMYVNEGTIAGNTQYVIFGSSFKNIVTK